MGAFGFGKDRLGGGIVMAAALWLMPATGWAYTADEQQACSDDAFRLCSAEIPDVPRVTACMVRRQAELSPGCRVYFHQDEPPAAKPLKAHKPQKPRKPRKRAH